jgi:hypothetical protein
MAHMTERMKELFDKVSIVVLSTVSEECTPNAVPVGAKKIIDDETILMSDPFFNKTAGQHEGQSTGGGDVLGRTRRIPAQRGLSPLRPLDSDLKTRPDGSTKRAASPGVPVNPRALLSCG